MTSHTPVTLSRSLGRLARTFPAQIEQARGTRPDVLVVNLSLLNVGDYARSLHRLYEYMLSELVTANARNDARRLDGPRRRRGQP